MLSRLFHPLQPTDAERSGQPFRSSNSQPARHILAAVLLLVVPLSAQTSGISVDGVQDGAVTHSDRTSGSLIDAQMEARRLAALNQQRQKQLVSDAAKLLKLARELNADADAGGTILSPAQRMHMAAEIEKLAKEVKDRMTYAIGAPNDLAGPFAVWQR